MSTISTISTMQRITPHEMLFGAYGYMLDHPIKKLPGFLDTRRFAEVLIFEISSGVVADIACAVAPIVG